MKRRKLVAALTAATAGLSVVAWFWSQREGHVALPQLVLLWPRDEEMVGEAPHLILIIKGPPVPVRLLEENRTMQVELFEERPQRSKHNLYGQHWLAMVHCPSFVNPNFTYVLSVIFQGGDCVQRGDGSLEIRTQILREFRHDVERGAFKFVEVSTVRTSRSRTASYDGPQREFLARFQLEPFRPGAELPRTAARLVR